MVSYTAQAKAVDDSLTRRYLLHGLFSTGYSYNKAVVWYLFYSAIPATVQDSINTNHSFKGSSASQHISGNNYSITCSTNLFP